MKKNYNVIIEDNGAAFLVVINNNTSERLVVAKFNTLAEAWAHIVWMYRIEQQDFTVGKKERPVVDCIDCIYGMRKESYID